MLGQNEAVLVVVIAFVLAFAAALLLRSKGRRGKNEMELKGELGKLKWIYTGTGQIAIFLAVFLAIVVVYIALRLTPGT